ncbi:hypothetical protein D9756_008610 [Leucocoprinus leucothites]|uniref:DUF6534 domain-containing protein n=1 Tax=Leucocoprinus leucothites TaxID=201217 RepID=A0A8H5FVT8_9AGAR|nr:hypothetical protein D9756_008610 [Leucoagaricus leucothites]
MTTSTLQSQFAATIGAWVIGATASTGVRDGTFAGIVLGMPSRIANGALASSIVVDWTITICLVSFFRKNQGTRTRTLMQTLMLYAMNFGLLISLTDLIVLVLANIKWQNHVNLYQVSLFEVVGNFYANTVLASLNSRTLVAEHLYRSRNFHSTSINEVSTQIHGFHHPTFSSTPAEGVYHVPVTIGNDGNSKSTRIETGGFVDGRGAEEGRYQKNLTMVVSD